MVDSFFSRPGKKRKAGAQRPRTSLAPRNAAARGPRSLAASNGTQNNHNDEDEDDDITSQSSAGEEEADVTMGEDSEEEFGEETAVDKRRRLAKQYIENIATEEEIGEGFFDAADLDRDIIARRLKQDVAEDEGKIYRDIGSRMNVSHLNDTELKSRTVRTTKTGEYALSSVATHYPYAYTTAKDGTIVKWDLSQLDRPRKLRVVRSRGKKNPASNGAIGHHDEILCIAASPDGKYVVTGGRDLKVIVWSAENLAPIKSFDTRDRKGIVLGLTFRNKTNELYAACADLKVRTYNLDQLSQVETLFGHQDQVADISALGQERCLTVGSRDKTAIIWKISEESRLTFRGGDTNLKLDKDHPETSPVVEGSIDCCSMIDNQLFVTGSDNGSISLWSLQKKKPLYVHREGHGRDGQLQPDEYSAEQSTNRDLTADLPPPQPRYITSIYAIPYSDVFFTGSWSGEIKIWKLDSDLRKFSQIGSLPSAKGVVNRISAVEFGPRNKETFGVIAAVSKEHRLGRWLKVKGGKNGLFTGTIETQK